MVIAPRQSQPAGATVAMPQPPTSQARLAAPQVAFLAGPGVKKSPPEQEVPPCSPVTSRWKVGLLLMEMIFTDLRVQGCFPLSRQAGVCAGSSPESRSLIPPGGDTFPFFIRF